MMLRCSTCDHLAFWHGLVSMVGRAAVRYGFKRHHDGCAKVGCPCKTTVVLR